MYLLTAKVTLRAKGGEMVIEPEAMIFHSFAEAWEAFCDWVKSDFSPAMSGLEVVDLDMRIEAST